MSHYGIANLKHLQHVKHVQPVQHVKQEIPETQSM